VNFKNFKIRKIWILNLC